MPVSMQLVVTLRKDVADREEGHALFQMVEERFADKPEIKVTGHVTNHFVETPPSG